MYVGAHEALKAVVAIDSQAIASTSVNGDTVDTVGFESGEALFVLRLPAAVGVGETVDVLVHTADGTTGSPGTFAEMPNQAYTQLTNTNAGAAGTWVGRVNLINANRFIRIRVTTAGGSVTVAGMWILMSGKSEPVAQENSPVLFNIAADLTA